MLYVPAMISKQEPALKDGAVKGFAPIQARAESYIRAVQENLMQQVDAFEPEIRDMARYCMEKGGNRIRPVLVHFAGYREGASPDPEMVRMGTVIELVHMATLVHDDILDDAAIRHGRPSVKEVYGPSVAVLLGDAVFAHALVLAAEFSSTDICRQVAASSRKVVAGEIHQTFEKNDIHLGLDKYYRAIELKTAELFRLSCFLGATAGGYAADYAGAAGRFGLHLGNAYQIYDDMVDFFGTEQIYGKTLHTDLMKGKYTLPLLLLHEAMDPGGRARLLDSLRRVDESVLREIKEGMLSYGVRDKVMAHFERELDRAEQALKPFADYESVPRLMDLVLFVREQILFLT